MKNAQHTPGPWVLSEVDPETGSPTFGAKIYGADNYIVADCTNNKRLPYNQLANARLIAAAPDGLSLAELVLTCVNQGHPIHPKVVQAAQAVIAKAEGK